MDSTATEPTEDTRSYLPEIAPPSTTLLRPLAPPDQVIEAHKEAVALIEKALEHGTDYGRVPGTDKDTLLKPGAERLCGAYGVVPTYEIVEKEIDHDRVTQYKTKKWIETSKRPDKPTADAMKLAGLGKWKMTGEVDGRKQYVWFESEEEEGEVYGLYRYVIRCALMSRATGKIVGDGLGSCSTMESKYIRHPRDMENTVLKMAEKRALIAATLNAFGLSDRFTQDVEDMAPGTPVRGKQTARNTNPVEAPAPADPLRWAKDFFFKHVSTKRVDWAGFVADCEELTRGPDQVLHDWEPVMESIGLWEFMHPDREGTTPEEAEVVDATLVEDIFADE